MNFRLKSPVSSAELARELGLDHSGADAGIEAVAGLGHAQAGDLSFSSQVSIGDVAIGAIVICRPDAAGRPGTGILAGNPRLAFIRALALLDAAPGFDRSDAGPVVDPTARIGSNVVIEPGVTIGAGTWIDHGVVLHRGTRIGRGCIVKANSVIGGNGFGFERDEEGRPVRFLHLGGVVIEDEVEIGALNTVVRGALGDTRVGARTKTDDHVHIAHNVVVGEDCLITACAEISGGVTIGNRVWIGPNVSIIDRIAIGEDAVIGLGAVVAKPVPAGATVTGNPAEEMRLFTRKRAAINALLK
jgi:UDP-3-O-[3-hydroxymyristoyl] glucosamine N-acyltransferase